jgi:hypothetical protein
MPAHYNLSPILAPLCEKAIVSTRPRLFMSFRWVIAKSNIR